MFEELIIGLVVLSLIVGALGRLLVPGPNPMSIWMTILVGFAGALLGGVVGALVFHQASGLLLAIPAAAFIVWWIERSRAARYGRWG